jgi:hypothetical protein
MLCTYNWLFVLNESVKRLPITAKKTVLHVGLTTGLTTMVKYLASCTSGADWPIF